jgi:hypothetical protein
MIRIAGREFPSDRCIRVRIRATAQVIDMVPSAAAALVNGGRAELVNAAAAAPERAVKDPRKETSTAREQKPTPKQERKRS